MTEKKFDKVKYKNEFISKTYDRINLIVPKGKKDVIKAFADSKGKSINGFVNEAINEKMERDRGNK